ncbi:uncharacterized protein LOC127288588 [Leptopilina boulardi]|uniref:uncharacterized protein LOC127288588 n=1 Tax=Leptopilina boulardi TaxID=63433 RepID=UPI0021F5911B|nr:uncharacterized protein LOC127288588 [Leptopilina boulardi]
MMEVKPVPKPRSIHLSSSIPIPAPRTLQVAVNNCTRSTSPSESSQSEKSDDTKSQTETKSSNSEFFKNLKDEISEKMTVKGRAVISSTRNASIRLEKSVKNLITRRLASLNQDDLQDIESKVKSPIEDDRCTSLPANDIFSSISFYSPLKTNLKSIKNEEDLTGARYSPPPPVYPPPPLPDESIYDELQSVTSGNSGSRYDTLSSTFSERERDFSEPFNLLKFAQNHASDSDQSLNISDSQEVAKKLSRSDSWTFYDAAQGKSDKTEGNDELDRISSADEDDKEPPIRKRISSNSNISHVSMQNSLYENWVLKKNSNDENTLKNEDNSPSGARREQSKSVLYEFDPFAKNENNVYSNYENNDLLLLKAFLENNESASSGGSANDIREEEEEEDDIQIEEEVKNEILTIPPTPPRRFDSLPKNEYDEVEMVEVPEKLTKKSPALLPKLAHLASRKQPAVPPRKSAIKNNNNLSTNKSLSDTVEETIFNKSLASGAIVKNIEEKRTSVMQRLMKPNNMINFVKNGSKLLSRNKELVEVSVKRVNSKKLERPITSLGNQNPPSHRGVIYRSGVGIERAKDLVSRAAVLIDQKLSFYSDKSMSTLKEVISLEKIHSIHLLQDVKVVDGENVHCIAIHCEERPRVHVFYAKGITERRIWAQRILEAMTPVFPIKYTSLLTRAGWAYLKEGVTGSWFPAWVLLHQRTLVYTRTLNPVVLEKIDLRKARCIVLREQDGPKPEAGNIPVVVVDAGGSGALHLVAPLSSEAAAWRHAFYQAATNSGPALNQQQLNQDNVPVILDKCINFIYAHGIMTEGIYRRSGSSSAVVKLLEAFRRDAWATQITKDFYSEHDVATVLRRFLRDLPDPLFPSKIHDQLCSTIDLTNDEEKVTTYRNLLTNLDTVTTATLHRILEHLHCLTRKSSKNLMTVDNISAIWGPTLMHAGGNSAEDWNRSETKVVADLIRLYPKLYKLSAADLAREAKILEVLERHHISNNGLRGAPSGDLKIWIYLLSREGECVNVTIGPQKTAFDICREFGDKVGCAPHELCLEEYDLAGALERPLHHSERVLEVVARWGYWDPEDRKDNVLILRKDRLYKDIVPLVKPPMTISGELKFADTKTKNWKSYLFEFSQAKLCCYKDKVCSIKLHEWKIEDIVWYLGHEPKRNPQMGWSITFILKNNKPTRCKENPYFGYTLAGASKDDQYRWLAAMLFGEYQCNLIPSAVNLMDA